MSIEPTEPGINSQVSSSANQIPLVITPAAINKLKAYEAENEEFKGKAFRVYIEGGGCAGFRYGFGFDDAQANDFSAEFDGLSVAIDPLSMQYLHGATIDFVETLQGSGFVVKNPNAKTSCGCGHSFNG